MTIRNSAVTQTIKEAVVPTRRGHIWPSLPLACSPKDMIPGSQIRPQCLMVFLEKERMNDQRQYFCVAFGTHGFEPPRQIEDRSPFVLATLTCTECPGTMLQKPVFENNEALGRHYVLGHKAFALKEVHERDFPACPFPTICPDHYEWAKCEEKLTD